MPEYWGGQRHSSISLAGGPPVIWATEMSNVTFHRRELIMPLLTEALTYIASISARTARKSDLLAGTGRPVLMRNQPTSVNMKESLVSLADTLAAVPRP